MKELQRQQEEQRELQRVREEEVAASASRRENTHSKLSVEFLLPKMKLVLKGEEGSHKHKPTGWVVESTARSRLDSSDDPFLVQRQQLLEYREQALQAGRMDEVAAMEDSLRDIEAEIQRRDR